MRWWRRGGERTSVPTLQRGEQALASATGRDGTVVVATRDAFHVVPPGDQGRRVPWEEVEAADWDDDSSTFRLSEVGDWGQVRPEHRVVLDDDAALLLQLVRERVTASIVLQRHVQVASGALRVIGRRAPHGAERVSWVFEYDQAVDPDDPAVRAAAQEALARAKDEVGHA